MSPDARLFTIINGWSGHIAFIDTLLKGLANDYFLLISFCLVLVFWWFGTRGPVRREAMQRTVLTTLIAIGFANGLVAISNQFFFRIRPFNVLPEGSVNLLFYRPTDSSFPSNFTATLTSIAVTVFLRDKKWGGILLGVALLGGFSRVYIGVHYPLDILGGAAFGAVASLAAFYVSKLTEPLTVLVLKIIRLIHLA